MKKNYYVTSPIYYVNDVPHIGHAYTTLACDMLARFHRQDGYDVTFLTGTDEHGQKVEKSSITKGIPPKDFVDQVSQTFRDLFTLLGTSHTVFARTSQPEHYKAAQEIWNRLMDNGDIYLGEYSGWYAVRDEAFYGEDEIVDGKAPTGAPVEYVTESSYFFRLSKYQEPLLDYFEKHPDFILPESRRNEVISFVKSGLRDLSISRTSITWGVPVPNDPKHVMYVWLDALTIYLSGIGFPENIDHVKETFKEAIHIVGKDILRFHAVYWPAFLMSSNLPLPKRIVAHGWWTKDGEKISKSVGNPVDPVKLAEDFGIDATRYFLLREVPFGQDGDFSEAAFINRLNADLANTYGNLVQRTLAFIYKNQNGIIPVPQNLSNEDQVLLDLPSKILEDLRHFMDKQQLSRAIEKMWEALFEGNKYMDIMKPWQLKNEDPARMGTILYTLTDFIRQMAILTSSIVPSMSGKILDMLSINQTDRDFTGLQKHLKGGEVINEPQPLVQKVVK